MNDIFLGVKLMGFGLAGVFSVLIIFYLIIQALKKIFH